MINLIIKNVIENGNKINSVAKYVNKINKRHCLLLAMLTANTCLAAIAIKTNQEKINELETELEVIKSKIA